MFGMIWVLSARIRHFLRRYMPTNILLAALRTRRGLRWGVPAMLIAIPYLVAAVGCAALLERGGGGWLNILVLLFVWNALKFLIAGPVCLARLVHVRVWEARARRSARVRILSEGVRLYRVVEFEQSTPGRSLELTR